MSNDALLASEKGFKKLMSGFSLISQLDHNNQASDFNVDQWISKCYSKMNDDFNTPMLIAEIFDCVKFINNVNINTKNLNTNDKEKLTTTFNDLLFNILGFNNENEESKNNNSSDELISLLIKIRNEARLNKNYDLSDKIRDKLANIGVNLNDKD